MTTENTPDADSTQPPEVLADQRSIEALKRKAVFLGPPGDVVDRVTINVTVHHECEEGPTSIVCISSHELEEKEQPYQRRCRVDEKWQKINTDWVEDPGTIVIESLVGKHRRRNPSDEEKENDAKQFIYVAFKETPDLPTLSPLVIHPGGVLVVHPMPGTDIFMISAHGEIKINLSALTN